MADAWDTPYTSDSDTWTAAQQSQAQSQAIVATDSGGGGASGSMAAGAGVVSAVGSMVTAHQNMMIARLNANLERQRAEQAIQAGDFAAMRRQIVQNQLAGRTQAAQAAGGTVVGAGTNGAVLASQRAGAAEDEYLTRLDAARQADSMRIQATGTEIQGRQAMVAGEQQAVSTLINTGSDEWLYSDPSFDPRFGRGLAIGAAGAR